MQKHILLLLITGFLLSGFQLSSKKELKKRINSLLEFSQTITDETNREEAIPTINDFLQESEHKAVAAVELFQLWQLENRTTTSQKKRIKSITLLKEMNMALVKVSVDRTSKRRNSKGKSITKKEFLEMNMTWVLKNKIWYLRTERATNTE